MQARESTSSKRFALRAMTIATGAVLAGMAASAGAATWNDVANTITFPVNTSQTTFSISPSLVDGDSIRLASTTAIGLSNLTLGQYYYVVGQGSTPGSTLSLAAGPGGNAIQNVTTTTAGNLTAFVTNRWTNSANWTGGVPNGVGAVADFVSANTANVGVDANVTVGSINYASDSSATNNFSLTSTYKYNGGPVGILRFATASGAPTVTINNASGSATPRHFTFGDVNAIVVGGNPSTSNSNARLIIAGNQGLTIVNNNPIAALPQNNTLIPAPTSLASASSAGSVRFGSSLDWQRFSGDVTLAKGAFAAQMQNSSTNGAWALPMTSKVIVGTGSNEARLEMVSNSGALYIRGLEGNSQSRVVNNWGSGGPNLGVGTLSEFGDVFTFNGNIGIEPAANIPAQGTGTGQQINTPGQIRLVKHGASTQRLLGDNTFYNGQNVLNGGVVDLGSTGTIGKRQANPGAAIAYSSEANAALAGAPSGQLWMHNGELRMAGSTVNDRSLTFSRLIQQNNSSPATNSDGLYILTLDTSAQNSLSATYRFDDGVANTTVDLEPRNGTTNANGSTALYRGTNLGVNPVGTAGSANIVFTVPPTLTGTAGQPTYGVIKGALADTSATGNGAGFATIGANGVRLLASTEQNAANVYPAVSTAQNYVLNATAGITGVTTQTLQIDAPTAPVVITNTGTTLNASQGFLFSGSNAVTLTGGTITGTASADREDVVFLNTNSAGVTISSNVSNPGAAGSAGAITFSGPGAFTITGNTLTVGNTGMIVFNAPYGSSSVTNTLDATVTGASILAVNGGTLKLGSNVVLTNSPIPQVASGATLDLNGKTGLRFNGAMTPSVYQGTPRYYAGGEITNSSSTTVDLVLGGGSAVSQFGGRITGNLNLVITQNGTNANLNQIIANRATYTGSTTVISNASLQIGRYGQLPATTALTLGDATTTGQLILGDGNGAQAVDQEVSSLVSVNNVSGVIGGSASVSTLTVNYNGPTPIDYRGRLGYPAGASVTSATTSSVNLALRKTGTGTLILSNATSEANRSIGGVVVEGGILSISRDNHLGQLGTYIASGSNISTYIAPTTLQQNALRLNGGSLQTTATIVMNSLRGVGVGPLDGATGGTGGIIVDPTFRLIYGGVIANAGNTGSNTLNVSGGGTLQLNGASTMTGAINVVGLGTTLGGSGSVAASVSIGAGASLAPGTSPGTFTINNSLSLDPTSSLSYELLGTNTAVGGGVNDLTTGVTNLVLDGTLNVTEITAGSFLSAGIGNSWRIIDYSGTLTDNGLTLGTLPTLTSGLFFVVDASTPGQINLAVIPEPTSLVAIGAVAGLVLRRRR